MDDKRNVNGVAQSFSDGDTNKDGLCKSVLKPQCYLKLELTSRLVELVLSSARSLAFIEVFAIKASRVF
jgi:hypothetical protein